MVNTKFEVYKIQREIKRSGVDVEFCRPSENEYGEKDYNNIVSIGSIRGLYHEISTHISLQTGEITQYRTKKEPALLSIWNDVNLHNLRTGDIAIVNGKNFLVTKVANIQEWNLIADINLEVQDIGL